MGFQYGHGDPLQHQYIYIEGPKSSSFKLLGTTLAELAAGHAASSALQQIPVGVASSTSRLRLYFPQLLIATVGAGEAAKLHGPCYGSLCDGQPHGNVVVCRLCKKRGLHSEKSALFHADAALNHLQSQCSGLTSLSPPQKSKLIDAFRTVDADVLAKLRKKRREIQEARRARVVAASSVANDSIDTSFASSTNDDDRAVNTVPSVPSTSTITKLPSSPSVTSTGTANTVRDNLAASAMFRSSPSKTSAQVTTNAVQPAENTTFKVPYPPKPATSAQKISSPTSRRSTPNKATPQVKAPGEALAIDLCKAPLIEVADHLAAKSTPPSHHGAAGSPTGSETPLLPSTTTSSLVERLTSSLSSPPNKKRSTEEVANELARKRRNVKGETNDRDPASQPGFSPTAIPALVAGNASTGSENDLDGNSQKSTNELPNTLENGYTRIPAYLAASLNTVKVAQKTIGGTAIISNTGSSATTPPAKSSTKLLQASITSLPQLVLHPRTPEKTSAIPCILQDSVQHRTGSSAGDAASAEESRANASATSNRPVDSEALKTYLPRLHAAPHSRNGPTWPRSKMQAAFAVTQKLAAGGHALEALLGDARRTAMTDSRPNNAEDYPAGSYNNTAELVGGHFSMDSSCKESSKRTLQQKCSPMVGRAGAAESPGSYQCPHRAWESIAETEHRQNVALARLARDSAVNSHQGSGAHHPMGFLKHTMHTNVTSSPHWPVVHTVSSLHTPSYSHSGQTAAATLPPTPRSATFPEASRPLSHAQPIHADASEFPTTFSSFTGILLEAGVASFGILAAQVPPESIQRYVAYLQRLLDGRLGDGRLFFQFEMAINRTYEAAGLLGPALQEREDSMETGSSVDHTSASYFTKGRGMPFPEDLIAHTELLAGAGIEDFATLAWLVSADDLELYVEYLAGQPKLRKYLYTITARFSLFDAFRKSYRKHTLNDGMEGDLHDDHLPRSLAKHSSLFTARSLASLADIVKSIPPQDLALGIRVLAQVDASYCNSPTKMFSLTQSLRAAYRELGLLDSVKKLKEEEQSLQDDVNTE